MNIRDIVAAISIAPDCKVFPPIGMPVLGKEYNIPDDLRDFYSICGGAILFESAVFSTHIVSPNQFVPANPTIISGVSVEELRSTDPDSITWSWYIVANSSSTQYMTIDLHPSRFGRCYDSRWDRHAEDTMIIALSFTEFLHRTLFFSNLGEYYYWSPPEGIAQFDFIGKANNY